MKDCHTIKKECCGNGRDLKLNECGCHGTSTGFRRRFISPGEIKEHLGNYREELVKELNGVEEELKKYSSK